MKKILLLITGVVTCVLSAYPHINTTLGTENFGQGKHMANVTKQSKTINNTKTKVMENKEKIVKQVTNFIDGADKSNLELLNLALHENFTNVQNGFFEKKGVFIINKEKYLSLVADETFGGVSREMEVISIDIEGNIAMVKANLKSEKLIFTSFISLVLDEAGQWKVIGNFPFISLND